MTFAMNPSLHAVHVPPKAFPDRSKSPSFDGSWEISEISRVNRMRKDELPGERFETICAEASRMGRVQ